MTDIKDDVSVDGTITSTGEIEDGAGNKLSQVSSSVANILNGTTTVPKAASAVSASSVTFITISDQAPTGGSDGDIWIQY